MPPSSGELWGHHLMPTQIDVDCLLPTGVFIPLTCNRDATMERVKSELWAAARFYPLFHVLSDPSSYIFVGITQDAEREEFYDETRRLCDLRLFQPILKIVEPAGNREEKMLNYEIGLTVGIPVNDFNEIKELEAMTFRRSILDVCQEAVAEREQRGLALYAYPPDLESSPILPEHLKQKLNKSDLILCIWVVAEDSNRSKYTFRIPHNSTPIDVISEAIRKRGRVMSMTEEQTKRCIEEYSHMYMLKVCGYDQFLLSEQPISQYKYIRMCLSSGQIPQLMLLTKESIYATLPRHLFVMPAYVQRGRQLLADIDNQQTVSLWEVRTKLRIKINCATYFNVKELGKIYVMACIYHGTEPLCEMKKTQQVESTNPRWNCWIEFLPLPDLPRSAKLCLSICAEVKKRNKKVNYALCWGNLQLFDFNNRLLSDKMNFHLWPTPQGMDELLNSIGIPGPNPDRECPCLEIEFDRFSYPVSFPPDNDFEKLTFHICQRDENPNSLETYGGDSETEIKTLDDIFARDPLSDIFDQEKELLWKRREYCLTCPSSLPKLLSAVKWNDSVSVAQMYSLLKRWPVVSPEVALQLLDCLYSDLKVRKFAVECLSAGLSDDLLYQYLLQLVQVLKFEPYLDNPMTRFLLKRALLNQKIGQSFFWHLKSEMHHSSIRLRFGLILEAFCRGCGPFLKVFTQQVEALDKLTKLTDTLKTEVNQDINDQIKFLLEQLQQLDYQDVLQRWTSPLNCSHLLGDLIRENCKVQASKKRPLWLVWRNPDPLADIWYKDFKIIFKNGDDLRQDMLTLQVIRLMDQIWKNEGLDLRMVPYGCLATGKSVGLIEVVRNAKTIMEIHGQGGTRSAIAMDSLQLHKWIERNNEKNGKYEAAIETFTKSCAGYCVATFVLGIGDRHSENIMVTEDGQVFHIDFGHFLDHKKKKFGINRERVPFVLTEDFIRVIAKGADRPKKTEEYVKFQELCCNAYQKLRKYSHFFITLFTLMLSCGIPELQSLDDISYLRKTLAVEKTEAQALKYFRDQLQRAYGDQWTTKVDWTVHNIVSKIRN